MNLTVLQTYLRILGKLNRASINGVKAPHKPILLLSVIQSYESGEIKENRIEITGALVARFRDNWNWLVKDHFFHPKFELPFYHLHHKNSRSSKEKFWFLKSYPGKEILLTSSGSIRSFSQLKESVAYAFLDEPLFELMQKHESRMILQHFILDHYFKNASSTALPLKLFDIVEKQILQEAPSGYQQLIEQADEEEIFVRCAVFKKVIPQIYNYTCCISGMRITSGYDIQMIDACHIIPFAESHNDTISNGISLSPNLHRAFDRGLVAVDSDYTVLVSDHFIENESLFSIKSYAGKPIFLPSDEHKRPALENFAWHRAQKFKG